MAIYRKSGIAGKKSHLLGHLSTTGAGRMVTTICGNMGWDYLRPNLRGNNFSLRMDRKNLDKISF